MSEMLKLVAEWSVLLIEVLGIAIITLVALYALFQALRRLVKEAEREPVFQELRQRVGRGILLGLEFLIAADIIHTVAVDLTFYSVGVLAVVVLVRTFLSFTLEVELTGRWPWQEKR
ncbi:MAG: DUF1622 domain-containing protein [Thiohalophilus sp.]|uniref:DUF1622 domain-containing protein n=1 Tax=Thiohalophilus sp. TaxID=3028392 RepID=UPI00287097CE|nr:DUF1622 domain-containing protein [Thiohalophilus sp.]MDR9436770.1 DUF1622 domain-containing protein [Thiohalophilus sp.]